MSRNLAKHINRVIDDYRLKLNSVVRKYRGFNSSNMGIINCHPTHDVEWIRIKNELEKIGLKPICPLRQDFYKGVKIVRII